jgi:hypothetical protein
LAALPVLVKEELLLKVEYFTKILGAEKVLLPAKLQLLILSVLVPVEIILCEVVSD